MNNCSFSNDCDICCARTDVYDSRRAFIARSYTGAESCRQTFLHHINLADMRIFRGIAPDMRGAVLLRDKAYMEGNVDLWRELAKQKPDYKLFEKLLKESK